MAEAVVSVLLGKVCELIEKEAHLLSRVKPDVILLREKLQWIALSLKEADEKCPEDKEINLWVTQVTEAACEAQSIIDEFALQVKKNCFKRAKAFRKIGKKMQEVNLRLDKISENRSNLGLGNVQDKGEPSVPIIRKGRRSEVKIISTMPTGGDAGRSVVSIPGIGGLGKTTLTNKVFSNDMALPPNSPFRGVAAAIPQPAHEEDIYELREYIARLKQYNSQGPSILYRDPNNDQDIVEAVYRWDERPYREIFQTGFRPRDRHSTSFEDYYNLERHVNGGGAHADTSTADGSVFVSTTRSASWRPRVTTDTILYSYEIFAPGGIDTVLTLREHNDYPNQQEIAFVGGISPQYIRTACPYTVIVSPESQFPIYAPYGDHNYRNGRFNPNPTSLNDGQTTQEFMNRLRNVRCGGNMINLVFTRQQHRIEKRETEKDATTRLVEEKYVDPICSVGRYIECAFNFSNSEEAYLFIADQCLQINYAPGTTNDKIIKGPMSIGDGLPYLRDTIFASGIDAAFTSSLANEAYIFRNNIYALINFVKDGGHIIHGPKKITDRFYSLKGTIFEHGIDAAFASSKENEAYIFKGDQYAVINFAPDTTKGYRINGPKRIADYFPSLRGTIFQDGFDAAFLSSATNEAYIFKGNTYALINYAPWTTDDYIIVGPITPISDGFHSLKNILPMYPCCC